MKLECQSCLLQFDAVGAGPDSKCPRCGSTNVKGSGAAPGVQTGPASGPAAIAATIAQPMVAPIGAPGAPAGFNPVGAPAGGAPFGGAPSAPAGGGAFGGAPSTPAGGGAFGGPPAGGGAFGGAPSAPAGGAPFGAPPSPYGAPAPAGGAYGAPPSPYGAPQPAPAPYGAPPSPYGAPQAAPMPMGSPFGQPAAGFGAAPMGMVAVTPYGNAQVDAEQRKAMVWAIIALLFCWPAAIGAFVQYSASQQASRMGDYGTAMAKAKSAQMWGIVPSVIFGVLIGLACIGGFFGALAGA